MGQGKRRWTAALAAVLAAGLLLGRAAAAGRYPPKEHLEVDYAQMSADGFDARELEAALEAMDALCASPAIQTESPKTRAQTEALYNRIMDETDLLLTKSYLADIQSDKDQGDPELARQALALSEQVDRAYDALCLALKPLAGTPYQDLLEADAGEEGAAFLAGYEKTPEETFDLLREEERLVAAYEQAMASPAEVTVEGRVWTEETLEAASGLEEETYWELRGLLEQARGRRAGELYRQLVQVRTQIAAEAGYDDYAAYAYREVYHRDYGPEEIRTVYEAAKTHLVPLSGRLWDALEERALRTLDLRSRGGGEAVLDAIEPYLGQIDPELAETFTFMRAHHLYDIEADPNKRPTGYTVALPAYGTAFIFDSPYGGYLDYNTMIHEFGHFHETFRSTQRELWSPFHIDVGEIHSQGLEVLFLQYAEDLFGEDGRTFYWATLSNLVDSVLEGCLYDEFQTAVYKNPDQSPEELGHLFQALAEEYGYVYDSREPDWTWTEVGHTFSSPMYYVSYATSALSALDLWRMSLKDRDAAVEIYMDLTVLGMSKPYREAAAAVGLSDVFQPGMIQALAETLEERLERDFREGPDAARLLTAGGTAIAVLAAVGLPLSLLRRRPAA